AMAPSMAWNMPREQSCSVLSRSNSQTVSWPAPDPSRGGRCSAMLRRKGRIGSVRSDHGADTAIGQDLEQEAMRHAAVHDMHGSDAIACGIQGGRNLGQHAARDRTVLEEFVYGACRQAAQELAALVQNAWRIGQPGQFF